MRVVCHCVWKLIVAVRETEAKTQEKNLTEYALGSVITLYYIYIHKKVKRECGPR